MEEAPRVCIDRVLPLDRITSVAEKALEERATNAPMRAPEVFSAPVESLELALITSREWKPGRRVRVRFLDGEASVKSKVEKVAKEWSSYANITFEFGDHADADIRISFQEEGSWSYLGMDCLGIPRNEPTMNYGWLTPDSSDEEYERVVVHEFGHALACIHEHQNPTANIPWDKEAVYRYYAGPPNNWSKEDVDRNLFQPYSKDKTQFSEFDRESIMLYPIPEQHTIGQFSVGFNRKLSQRDKDFIGKVYPRDEKPVKEIKAGGPAVEASIGAHREEDRFRFAVAESGRHVIETEGPTDVVMALYGPDRETQLIASDDDSGRDYNARIRRVLRPGTYFVRVRHYRATGTGRYRVSVKKA